MNRYEDTNREDNAKYVSNTGKVKRSCIMSRANIGEQASSMCYQATTMSCVGRVMPSAHRLDRKLSQPITNRWIPAYLQS